MFLLRPYTTRIHTLKLLPNSIKIQYLIAGGYSIITCPSLNGVLQCQHLVLLVAGHVPLEEVMIIFKTWHTSRDT